MRSRLSGTASAVIMEFSETVARIRLMNLPSCDKPTSHVLMTNCQRDFVVARRQHYPAH